MSRILLQYPKNPKVEPNWRAREDVLRFFNIHSVAKHQKIEGGPFKDNCFGKKSHNAEKTERGPFSVSRCCMLRGKRGKTFLIQFARTNDSIWDHKIS